MAYTQDHRPYSNEKYQGDPNRPLEPRQRMRGAEHASSPGSFFALLFIVAAISFGGWLAYNHEFGSETTAALPQQQQLAAKPAPAVGTPAVTPSETTGSAPANQ